MPVHCDVQQRVRGLPLVALAMLPVLVALLLLVAAGEVTA
jgi:hypothetical protein